MLEVYWLINLIVAVCCHFTSALVSSSWLKRCSVFALSYTWYFEQVEVNVSHDVGCGIVRRPQAILQDGITGTVWPGQKRRYRKHPWAMRRGLSIIIFNIPIFGLGSANFLKSWKDFWNALCPVLLYVMFISYCMWNSRIY